MSRSEFGERLFGHYLLLIIHILRDVLEGKKELEAVWENVKDLVVCAIFKAITTDSL